SLMICCRECLGLLMTNPMGRAVEAQEATIGRQVGVKGLDLLRVPRADPAHTDVVVDHVPILAQLVASRQCQAARREGPSGTAMDTTAAGGAWVRDARARRHHRGIRWPAPLGALALSDPIGRGR